LGQTTSIQLGKKVAGILDSPPKSLAPVCLRLNARFDAFVLLNKISRDSSDYTGPVGRWTKAAAESGGCADGGLGLDQEWTTLYGQLARSTNDIERERYLSQISAQQTKVAAMEKYLSDSLELSLMEMQKILDNQAFEQQKAALGAALAALKSIVANSDTDKTSLLAELKKTASLEYALEDKISKTTDPLSSRAHLDVQSAATTAKNLDSTKEIADIKAAAAKLEDVYTKHLKDWKAK
jgi:hypothetical protein